MLRISGDTFWAWGGNTSSDTSIVVDNGGAARYGKQYSIKACKANKHKFLRPDYESIATDTNARLCDGKVKVIAALNCRSVAATGSIVKTYAANTQVEVSRYVFKNGAYWFKTVDGWISGNYVCGWVKVTSTDVHNQWWYLTGSKESKTAYYYDTIAVIDNCRYLFKPNGYALQDDWYKFGDDWYYAHDNCRLIISNWLEYNDASYYFDLNGKMATDAFIKAKNADTYYYIDKDGKWDGKSYP